MSRCKFERAVSVSDDATGDAARVRQRQDAPSRRRAGRGCAARGTRCLAGWGSTCSWRWRPAFRRRGRSARKPSGSNNRSSTHWVVEVAGRAVGQVRLKVIAAGRAGGRIKDSHLVHLALHLDVPDREDEQAAEQAGKGVEVVEPGMQESGDISQRTLRAERRPVDAPVAPESGDLRVGYEYATEGDQSGDDERVHLRARKEGERRNRKTKTGGRSGGAQERQRRRWASRRRSSDRFPCRGIRRASSASEGAVSSAIARAGSMRSQTYLEIDRSDHLGPEAETDDGVPARPVEEGADEQVRDLGGLEGVRRVRASVQLVENDPENGNAHDLAEDEGLPT
jgi:hypothetical protein